MTLIITVLAITICIIVISRSVAIIIILCSPTWLMMAQAGYLSPPSCTNGPSWLKCVRLKDARRGSPASNDKDAREEEEKEEEGYGSSW